MSCGAGAGTGTVAACSHSRCWVTGEANKNGSIWRPAPCTVVSAGVCQQPSERREQRDSGTRCSWTRSRSGVGVVNDVTGHGEAVRVVAAPRLE